MNGIFILLIVSYCITCVLVGMGTVFCIFSLRFCAYVLSVLKKEKSPSEDDDKQTIVDKPLEDACPDNDQNSN